MPRSLIVKGILVSILLLSFGYIIWSINQRDMSLLPSLKEETSPYLMAMEGLSYSAYDGDRLIAKIKADDFKINPRKFFVFNVKSLNEATLTNAKLEVHRYDDMPSEVDFFSFAQDILSLKSGHDKGKGSRKGMGFITRGVIKGLTLEVYNADKLSMVVRARGADIDFKKKETRLAKASLEDVLSRKLIQGRAVIWDSREKVFRIPGAYTILTPTGMTRGEGITVDLDFVVSAINPQALQGSPNQEKR
jgi:hypothetical protein